MKIGIISRSNLDDRIYWSGTPYNIYSRLKSLKKLKVVRIDCLNNRLRKIYALKREYLKYLNGIKYDEAYNESVAKDFSFQIQQKIKNRKIDFLLAFDASLIAYLETNVPIILWTDLLYSDYFAYYFKGEKISKETKRSIKNIENKAIKKCFKVILASKWALDKAKKKYKSPSSKFCLINLGPGFNKTVIKKNINEIIKQRSKNKLRLISLGVTSKRKGLDKVINLNNIINKKGINSKLTIIGIKKKKINDKKINLLGFIDKNKPNGEITISKNLLKNHFHILFSKFEAYGIALVEANSRGLPNITFKTGGITEIVKNDINGYTFNRNENLNKIADKIIKIFKNNPSYVKIAKSSYNEYQNNFSYDVIIPKFFKILNS